MSIGDRLPTLRDVIRNPQAGSVGNSRRKTTSVNVHPIGSDTSADGPASARARGRVGGRRPKLTEDQAALAQRLYDEREKTVKQIADMFGVPRSTVYGHLDKTTTVPRQAKKTAFTKS